QGHACDALDKGALGARRILGGGAGRTMGPQGAVRAGARAPLVRRRGRARDAVGHTGRRLGGRRARRRRGAQAARQEMKKALIAWSSGKDSAWALHEVRRAGEFEIAGALTTVTHEFCRVSMHGVREDLLAAQLEAARLPAVVVRIPFPCPDEGYERQMAAALSEAERNADCYVGFGGVNVEDLGTIRVWQLDTIG